MSRRKLRFDLRKNYARKKSSMVPCSLSTEMLSVETISTADNLITDCVVSIPVSIWTSSPAPDLPALHRRLLQQALPAPWICSLVDKCQLAIFQLGIQQQTTTTKQMVTICSDFTWTLSVAQRMVDIGGNTVFGGAPEYLSSRPDIAVVINILEHLKLCEANSDSKFFSLVERRNGKFLSLSGKYTSHVIVYTINVSFNIGDIVAAYEEVPFPSIRHKQCELLVPLTGKDRCLLCEEFR